MSRVTGRTGGADTTPRKTRVATVWLGGCAGCHMSFLDLDERLLELAQVADIVFSPIADVKTYPEDVDVALVEGAVVNEDNLAMIRQVRARTKVLVAFGDCSLTGNVPALRNLVPTDQAIDRAFVELATAQPQRPDDTDVLPRLLPRVKPIHHVVTVDAFVPGCPPPADRIWAAIQDVLSGGTSARPDDRAAKFG